MWKGRRDKTSQHHLTQQPVIHTCDGERDDEGVAVALPDLDPLGDCDGEATWLRDPDELGVHACDSVCEVELVLL